MTGVISGSGSLVKDGAGLLSLTGANSYAGGTQVNAGKVALDANTALGSGAATFAKDTELSLGISKGISVANAITTDGIIKQSNDFDSSLTGVISGTGSLVKDGAGLLSLTGANSYAGGTQVTAGKVALDANTALGTGAATFAKDTELSLGISKGVSVANAIEVNGEVDIHSGSFDSSLTGVISGSGSLVKDGTGTLNLQGTNTFVGNLSVSGGTLGLSSDANLGAASNKLILNNTTLMANLASVALNHDIDIIGMATADTSNNALVLNAKVAGGTLIKTGTGTLTLLSANNTQAKTMVTQGTVKVAENANLGLVGAVVELNGGTFESMTTQSYARNFNIGSANGTVNVLADTTVTLANAIDGTGKLNKTGTGTLVLAGTNNYAGGTAINAGTVVISQAANLGTGSLSISNATLQVNADVSLQNMALTGTANLKSDSNINIAGIVSGSGALVKQGTGNLTLAGVNTYSGGTTLKSGTLTLANGSSLGVGALTVEAGQVALADGFISTNDFVQNLANSNSSLIGNGTFSNVNVLAGQLNIDGNIIATNATQVNGLLFVNGKLTSNITVGSSGKLGGAGSLVGNLVVNGTLSPGNSPAILNVTGDVNQNTGSTLEIDIDGATAGTGAGHYDQVNATGTYNIAATGTTLDAKLRGITGSATNTFVPTLGQSFEVVKANAVVGTFATYKAPTSGLAAGTRLDIGYTPNSVRLYVTPQSYSTVANANNATGAAKFLDDVLQVRDNPSALIGNSDLAQLYNALLPSTAQQLNAAMVSMSPAIYAENVQAALALQQRLHNTQTLSDVFKKGGVALKGLYQEADIDSDGNGIAAKRTINGVQLSLDSEPYSNDWQMGATLSVVTKADIESQDANIMAKGQDVAVAVRKKVNDWMLGAELNVGSYDFDVKRNVVVGNASFKTYQNDIKTSTQGAALTASYGAGSWSINSGVRYNAVQQDGFSEAGNGLLKLTVADVDENQVVAMLGGTWSQTWKKSMWDIAPKFALQAEQILSGDVAMVNAKLGSQMVKATAAEAGKTLLRATAGLNFINVDGLNIGVDASIEEADGLSSQAARLIMSKSFK
ncbi:MAG: autotransporter-associated beta strand repeat-containing protein [Moraxellaceae bacterium]|nr:autotransporter-associated beta strand repeat-containing protein [Moraxellaceae bacterium]